MHRLASFLVVFTAVFIVLMVLILGFPNRTESQASQEQIDRIKEGIRRAQDEDFGVAEELFKQVLDNVSGDSAVKAAAYNNLADTYVLQGKYASAIDAYQNALQCDENDPSIYLNLGIVYHLQMEITKDEIIIDEKPVTAAKNDWKEYAERAFDNAFEEFEDADSACNKLRIPYGVPEYSWIQELLDKAAIRADKRKLAERYGTAGTRKRIRVYWKES
ncbi:tetratricopeptide repeat protein [Candidatus Poribacteria bacterium]